MNTTIKTILKNYPRLSNEQTAQLCERIKKGDVEARNTLALSNIGLIFEVLNQMHIQEQDKEDLFEECFIEYLEKINRYDPAKGKFSTFIFGWLKECIKKNNLLGMPIRFIKNNRKMSQIEDYYLQEYNRLPSEAEILKETGFSKKIYENYKSDKEFFFKDSLDRPLSEDADSSTMGELVEDDCFVNPEEYILKEDLKDSINKVMNQLSPRQKVVLDCLYNVSGKYEKPLSYREIQKSYGIGRGTAANDRDAAISKLKNFVA